MYLLFYMVQSILNIFDFFGFFGREKLIIFMDGGGDNSIMCTHTRALIMRDCVHENFVHAHPCLVLLYVHKYTDCPEIFLDEQKICW